MPSCAKIHSIPCAVEDVAAMLDRTQWADSFSWQQLLAVSPYIRACSACEGTVVFDEGAVEQYLGIIVQGRIEIVKNDGQRNCSVIATLVPGNTFGEMSLIDDEPRSARAVARGDVIMLIMTKDALLELADSKPALAFKLLWKIAGMLSRRLRRTSGQLVMYLAEDA